VQRREGGGGLCKVKECVSCVNLCFIRPKHSEKGVLCEAEQTLETDEEFRVESERNPIGLCQRKGEGQQRKLAVSGPYDHGD